MHGVNRGHGPATGAVARLEEGHGFGSNPGNLRMFSYVPPDVADDPALVVVLHGCAQTAAGYDHGAGWSTLADRHGFVLLLPEQQRANNPNGCFNWFQPEDTRRDHGEAFSIRQMIETMVTSTGIDRRRVFITGLSAGGAMTSAMLACYPEVFAAGAIIAGLPYGAAGNVTDAFDSMSRSPSRPSKEWGDLLRHGSWSLGHSHDGPWPRISIWHGDADRVVVPANAHEILKQWTDVHALPIGPSSETTVDGYLRQVWCDGAEQDVIEAYTISRMAHGTPLATGTAIGDCGVAGPFMLDVGISSSYRIAEFFGIDGADRHVRPTKGLTAAVDNRERGGVKPVGVGVPRQPLRGDSSNGNTDRAASQNHAGSGAAVDVGAVITQALKAAGLIKGE
jgi:poly(hydroxyalkanoate) depolymerase family esterase